MEGIFETMLFFLGLRVMLSQKQKEEKMGKRGKRGRKGKWQEVDDQLTVKELIDSRKKTTKTKKPFEDIKLPPPREAKSKPI